MADHALASQTYHDDIRWSDSRITATLRKVAYWMRDLTRSRHYSRLKAHGISRGEASYRLAVAAYEKAVRTARLWKRSTGVLFAGTLLLALAMIGTTFAGIYNMETTQVAGSMAYLPAIAVMFYLYRYAVGHSKPSRHRRGSVRPVW